MMNTMCISALLNWKHTFHDETENSLGTSVSQGQVDMFWLKFTIIEVTIIATFFTFPLLSLTVIQTQNLLRNTTTSRRFSKKKEIIKESDDYELGMTQSFVEGLLNE